MVVVATISSQINERITINGKVGPFLGGINELQLLVMLNFNRADGTLNLRLFNRENDINLLVKELVIRKE
jgi:hypothetical protein